MSARGVSSEAVSCAETVGNDSERGDQRSFTGEWGLLRSPIVKGMYTPSLQLYNLLERAASILESPHDRPLLKRTRVGKDL